MIERQILPRLRQSLAKFPTVTLNPLAIAAGLARGRWCRSAEFADAL